MTTITVDQGRNTHQRHKAYAPLLVDVGVPLGAYYLFKEAFGVSTFAALALSSTVPAVRTVWSVVRQRRLNVFALLILAVNVVGLALSFVSGDPRLMLVKDSGISSVIGVGVLLSVAAGRPMMTQGLKPFLVRNDPARHAAWDRLASGAVPAAAAFVRAERRFSAIWGAALLGECAVKVVGAYTLPVETMVWLGPVILVAALLLAAPLSTRLAARPMVRLLIAESTAAPAH
ncbi:hypothetical protein ITI46_19620 [Streptomyces oryzae]|uniref:Intracellular septation protein A n=1 Tax=Streptomyces oryzae TaxID=1434886 RepID=A0ABS3XEY4_9ACTN|nr:VC0807 family protein [Streptomyces oryzae]MBO8193854.1 hypothetical protein [Streptomyces oryzae]